jgi:hypothetical protein
MRAIFQSPWVHKLIGKPVFLTIADCLALDLLNLPCRPSVKIGARHQHPEAESKRDQQKRENNFNPHGEAIKDPPAFSLQARNPAHPARHAAQDGL